MSNIRFTLLITATLGVAACSAAPSGQRFTVEGRDDVTNTEFESAYVRAANATINAQYSTDECVAGEAPESQAGARAAFGKLLDVACAAQARGATFAPMQLVEAVPPAHPTAVLHRPLTGKTVVGAEIAASGAVARIEFLAETDPLIRKSVEDAVQQWRFTPATVDGEPVAAMVCIPFDFRN
jgi:outer membrane biosynthesis protein TonB